MTPENREVKAETIERAIRNFLHGTSEQIKQAYPDLKRKNLLEKFKSIEEAFNEVINEPNKIPHTSLINEQV